MNKNKEKGVKQKMKNNEILAIVCVHTNLEFNMLNNGRIFATSNYNVKKIGINI